MGTPLLTAKLNIPPARPGLVPRPRLMQLLQEGSGYNLVLASAPAGFGKTTLLAEWARQDQTKKRTAWVSLDEGENDPVRFWDCFIAAMETLQANVGERALALLHSPQPLTVDGVLLTLINDILTIPGDFTVILDDYQFIKAKPIHAGITFLLKNLPPHMHLVIATRVDPALPLALFRGRGMMFEIDADDLRFTLDEAASLLKEMKGPELLPEAINALNTRTEGWAVGLKMAALSMRRQSDVPGFIASFTGSQSYIMDYLLEEVPQQQPEGIQTFLLKTSILGRLTAPLCDAITGRTDSRVVLRNLERANLFIVPIDQTGEWYRYEHLFSELLRHQLELSYSTKAVSELHQRASRWYRYRGFQYDSIQHSLVARDWKTAINMICEASHLLIKTGEVVTLLNWLKAVPETVLRSNYLLYRNYIVALMFTFQIEAAEDALKYFEIAFSKDINLDGTVLACKATIAGLRFDMTNTVELSEKALSLLPTDALGLRGMLCLNLGKVKWMEGSFREADPLLKEAFQNGERDGNYWIAAWALAFLSNINYWHGKLQEAINLDRQAINLAGQSPAAILPHMAMAEVMYELNDLEEAVFHLEKALELSSLLGIHEFHEITYGCLMRIRLARGDQAGAREALEMGDQLAENSKSLLARATQAGRHFQFALAQNDLIGMEEWGKRFLEHGDMSPIYLRQYLVRIQAAQGQIIDRTGTGHVSAGSSQDEWLSQEWQQMWVTLRLYRALFETEPDLALMYLTEALTLARPIGLVRTFVDEGRLVAPLLRKVVSRGIEREYAARLLTIIEAENRLKAGRPSGPISLTGGLLSDRELEVLRHLETGLSDRQIADKLIISLSTAKTHVRHIFEKLNSQSRTEALARARELKLI